MTAALAAGVVAVVAVAALAPVLVDLFGVSGPRVSNPGTLTALRTATGPSSAHPFGVDDLGRDLLARVIYGVRSSLEVAALATAIAAALGTAVALIGAKSVAVIDVSLVRIADALLAFPVVLLGLAVAGECGGRDCVAGVVGPGFGLLVFVLAVSGGARVARFTRRRIGTPRLPPQLLGYLCVLVGTNMLLEAALSFLGAGLRGSDISFGQMISAAGSDVASGQRVWWYLVFPGVALTACVLAFVALGRRILSSSEARLLPAAPASAAGTALRAASSAVLVTAVTVIIFGARPHLMAAWNALPATLSLAGGAVVVGALFALPLGTIASVIRAPRAVGRAASTTALIARSAPVFWLAFVGIYLFAASVGLVRVFDGPASYAGLTATPSRWLGSLLLPWGVLALGLVAFYAPLLGSTLSGVMSEDHIMAARSKGLSERRVVVRHGLRAACPELLEVFATEAAALLGAVVLIETVFDIPGIGRLAYDSVRHHDLAELQGAVLLGALLVVIVRLVVELVRLLLDPRVRRR